MTDFVEVVLARSAARAAMLSTASTFWPVDYHLHHRSRGRLFHADQSACAADDAYYRQHGAFCRQPGRSRPHHGTRRAGATRSASRKPSLASMQTQLNHLLHQRRRLAELGLAVSKINHDLRNMLSSAQLISDRLGELPDPSVQRFAPKLIASLDRAIKFCNDTLRFGRAEEAAPRRELFTLAPLVDEVGDGLGLPREHVDWLFDFTDASGRCRPRSPLPRAEQSHAQCRAGD